MACFVASYLLLSESLRLGGFVPRFLRFIAADTDAAAFARSSPCDWFGLGPPIRSAKLISLLPRKDEVPLSNASSNKCWDAVGSSVAWSRRYSSSGGAMSSSSCAWPPAINAFNVGSGAFGSWIGFPMSASFQFGLPLSKLVYCCKYTNPFTALSMWA